MSSLFRKPKSPDIPVQQPVEEVEVVTEEAEESAKRERRRLQQRGRRATIISGIAAALKKRLGE